MRRALHGRQRRGWIGRKGATEVNVEHRVFPGGFRCFNACSDFTLFRQWMAVANSYWEEAEL